MKLPGGHARWLMWTVRKKKPSNKYTERNVPNQKFKRQEQAVFSHHEQTSPPSTYIFFEKIILRYTQETSVRQPGLQSVTAAVTMSSTI